MDDSNTQALTQSAERTKPAVVGARLPSGFKFGAATSAYQVEGAVAEDGRGPSIWDKFLHDPKAMHSGDHGDIACDHYHRFREDIAIMKSLGLTSYRLSISWSRIMPTGRGQVNEAGLAHYSRVVDELLAAGIEPVVTLYHWDLPLALQEEYGGWLSRKVLRFFAHYAKVVVKRLGDRVKMWSTFNEPEVIIAGYIGKGMAPAVDRPDLAYHVGHNLMVAHGLAVKEMRAVRPDVQVGIVLNLNIIDPADGSKAARDAASEAFIKAYTWYFDGLFKGNYPQQITDKLDVVPQTMPDKVARPRHWVRAGDMDLIAQPIDFLGINYYTRFVINGEGHHVDVPGVERTLMGWQVYPFGLARLLDDLNRSYKLPPMYITENGAALTDTVESGQIHDSGRAKFIIDHLNALATVITTAGVDVRGYFVWSLLDNLEWPLGFAKTFGIVHVDRANGLKRTIKDSGLAYAAYIASARGQ